MFFKLENWIDAEVLSELPSNVAHRESFGATHIQNEWRGLAARKCSQADGVRVSLPDYVYKSHSQINGPSLEHRLTYVSKHSITKFDRIVQAQDCDRRAPAMGAIFEHALTPQRRLRIFPLWINCSRFHCTTLPHCLKRIDVSSGKGDDAGITITFCRQTGQMCVHRPSQMGRTGGSKLARCHENDVLNIRKLG